MRLVILFVLVAVSLPIPLRSSVQDNPSAQQDSSSDEPLTRDLTTSFCKRDKECHVEYEFLQGGRAHKSATDPKYYLWIRTITGKKVTSEGAVRVVAIGQNKFDVTHFLPATDIVASPAEVDEVFPPALVEKIVGKARVSTSESK